uniref:Uncharacterized protein n=1 Tax=Fagus sylvatica TaxID=28930 RepID=A0A2N9H4W5_FAGSY
MAPGSRGIGAVFVHLSGEDSDQMGDAFGEPRVPRRSLESLSFQRTRARTDQLVASRKDSAREGGSPDVGFSTFLVPSESLRCLFLQGSGFAEIRAWTCEIWFRDQRPPGVFLVRLRAVFRSGFRTRPDKFLAIREFHVVHECVFFPTHPGLWINLLRVRKTLRASVATSVQALHRGELGFARYDPANGGRWNVPYAKGMVKGAVSSIQFFGLVNSPGQTLVKLGQPWSNLVKTLQTPGNVSRNRVSRVFGPDGPQSGWERLGQTLVKLRSTLVKLGQTLVKPWEMCPGPSSLGVFDATRLRWIIRAWVPGRPAICVPTLEKIPVGLRSTISFRLYVLQTWLGNPSKRSGTNWDLTFSRIAIGPGLGNSSKRSGTNWDLTLSRIAIGPGLGNSSKRSGTNWDLTLSRIAIGCLIEVVGSGGHRRSDRLAKGKAVAYAPESPPDTDDEYDAMEDVRTRVDASLARDLQADARPSSAPRQPTAAPPAAPPARSKRRKSDRDSSFCGSPYRRIHVVPGISDTLPRVAFDRATLSPLQWRIHYS